MSEEVLNHAEARRREEGNQVLLDCINCLVGVKMALMGKVTKEEEDVFRAAYLERAQKLSITDFGKLAYLRGFIELADDLVSEITPSTKTEVFLQCVNLVVAVENFEYQNAKSIKSKELADYFRHQLFARMNTLTNDQLQLLMEFRGWLRLAVSVPEEATGAVDHE